jgi:hypothetical protein
VQTQTLEANYSPHMTTINRNKRTTCKGIPRFPSLPTQRKHTQLREERRKNLDWEQSYLQASTHGPRDGLGLCLLLLSCSLGRLPRAISTTHSHGAQLQTNNQKKASHCCFQQHTHKQPSSTHSTHPKNTKPASSLRSQPRPSISPQICHISTRSRPLSKHKSSFQTIFAPKNGERRC